MLRSTFTVSSFTLLSRLLGFFRDVLVAQVFGSGIFSDAYFVAFRIPNLLRSIFAEGALTSAFVPTFTEESKHGPEAAQQAFTSIGSFLFFVTSAVAAAGIFFTPQIVDLFAPGFKSNPDARALCINLTMVMMPYIIFVSFVSLLNGALNSYGVYGASAKAQVYMNCVLILGGLVCLPLHNPELSAYVLSSSVIAGGIVQVLTQIPSLRSKALNVVIAADFYSSAVKKTIKLMIPAIFGAAVYQLTILAVTMFASLQETGSVSWLFYADRIVQLPIGVFSIALASVLLPHLSKARVDRDEAVFLQHLMDSLRYSSFILMPMVGFMAFFSLEIVHLLFERGAFNHTATVNTAKAVELMSYGIWFTTCYSMITRAFISKNDTRTPTLIGVCTLVSTLAFIILFCGNSVKGSDELANLSRYCAQLIGSPFSMGFAGLAISSTLSSAVGMLIIILLFPLIDKRIKWSQFVISSYKSLTATILSIGTLQLLANSTGRIAGIDLLDLIIQLALFVLAVIIFSFILRSRELMETLSVMRRFFKYDRPSSSKKS